ncbi:retrograde regulation protein 2 [Niveomyces insectorum RCEF 264]|uniref:Retrograde regulation protein 2 n=1 Tax=Niveomyces insectorum RCEF 264 TaxID=1081102 RepID=A0A167WVA3_9HYPO|nr:retrograde regulation protein 2 [Niveomyces insectorum RCEF 264]
MPPAVDVLTLANYAEKLPKWTDNDENQLHALVDMGSNGIRFSISDLSPPHARLVPCVYRERAAISLFDALESVGEQQQQQQQVREPVFEIPRAVIAQVADALARFYRTARDFGVHPDRFSVLATEALRNAANAGALIDAVAVAAPGVTVHLLAPEVETLFGAAGAGLGGCVAPPALMVDLGGGSVQLSPRLGYDVRSLEEAARAGRSLPYGAARLTRLAAAATTAAAAAAATEAAAFDVAATAEAKAVADARVMEAPYPLPRLGGYSVAGAVFADTARMRRIHHDEAGRKIYGLSKRRRAQFAAIAAVVDALVRALARSGGRTIRTATLWVRWGGSVAPADAVLLATLRALLDSARGPVGRVDPAFPFWAEYLGGVAAVVALFFPAGPGSIHEPRESIRFTADIRRTTSGTAVVHLHVDVVRSRTTGLDVGKAVAECFKPVGKRHSHFKVKVHTTECDSIL